MTESLTTPRKFTLLELVDPKLLEIYEQLQDGDIVNEETGEVISNPGKTALKEYFNELTLNKVDNCVEFIETLSGWLDAFKAKIDNDKVRLKTGETAYENLKHYFAEVCKSKNHTVKYKLKGKIKAMWYNVTSVFNEYEEKDVPDEYKTITVTMPKMEWNRICKGILFSKTIESIDKVRVKDDVESGKLDNKFIRNKVHLKSGVCR